MVRTNREAGEGGTQAGTMNELGSVRSRDPDTQNGGQRGHRIHPFTQWPGGWRTRGTFIFPGVLFFLVSKMQIQWFFFYHLNSNERVSP